jgi:hypothetical protein
MFYDGQFVEIVTDENAKTFRNCYGVSKVIARCNKVKKIKLRTMDAEDAFLENPDAEFEQDPYNKQRHQEWNEAVEKYREEGRKWRQECEEMDKAKAESETHEEFLEKMKEITKKRSKQN